MHHPSINKSLHSGVHFTGTPPLLFSISQNPAKDQALAALPSVAALICVAWSMIHTYFCFE